MEKEVSDLKITCQMVEKRAQEQKQVTKGNCKFKGKQKIMDEKSKGVETGFNR